MSSANEIDNRIKRSGYSYNVHEIIQKPYTSLCGTGFVANGHGLMSTEVNSGNMSLFLLSANRALSL